MLLQFQKDKHISQHPFAGRRGSAKRDVFALQLYAQQGGLCRMCAIALPPGLRGRSGQRSAVVDHLRPWRLRPDLSFEVSNLQLICRACHATCDSIERSNWPDADLIAEAKARSGQQW